MITTGMCTQSSGGTSAILDYGMVTQAGKDLVERMRIDEGGKIMSGSDHVALILDLKIKKSQKAELPRYETVNIPRNPNFEMFHDILDRILQSRTEEHVSLNEHCKWLQSALLRAGKEAFGTRDGKVKRRKCNRIPRTMRKLRQLRKNLAGMVRRKAVWKTKYSWWTDQNQKSLENDLDKLKQLNKNLSDQILNHKLKIRSQTRRKIQFGTKDFWNLANKVMRKSSEINAVEGEDREIITERVELQRTVLEELAKIFKGKTSKIFTHKGQQLIKVVKVKHLEDHKRWILDNEQPDKHEEEVCRPATVNEIKDIVKRNKDSRASGVDELPTLLFINATQRYLEELTDLVNDCLLQGETPECLNTGKMTLIDKKEASLQVNKKRPLTVSSQIQSVITRLLAQRMDKICEAENYYGTTQLGFRSGKEEIPNIHSLL